MIVFAVVYVGQNLEFGRVLRHGRLDASEVAARRAAVC